MATITRRAGVAQSAERLTRNEQVRGSIPLSGSDIAPRPLSQDVRNSTGRRRVEPTTWWQSIEAWDHGG